MSKIIIRPDPEPLKTLFDSFTEDFKVEFTNKALNAVAESYLKSVQNSDLGVRIKNKLEELMKIEIFGSINTSSFSSKFLDSLKSASSINVDDLKLYISKEITKSTKRCEEIISERLMTSCSNLEQTVLSKIDDLEKKYTDNAVDWLTTHFQSRVDARINELITRTLKLKQLFSVEEYAEQLFNQFNTNPGIYWITCSTEIRSDYISRAKKMLEWVELKSND